MRLLDDLRSAFRSLSRRPSFTAVAALILGLGIGANTAIFSVVDTVLLKSLPWRDPDRLVVVWADGRQRGMSAQLATTPGVYLDWRDESGVFSGLAALNNASFRITSVEQPVVPLVHRVTANYFEVLGVEPLLGRGFRPGEDAPGAEPVVMLAYDVWQSVFGGDPGIVGSTVSLDQVPHTVVGVAGPRFFSAHLFAVQPGLWVPYAVEAERDDRATRGLIVYGRLLPGRELAEAQAALGVLSARLAAAHPATDDRWDARVVPLRDHAVGRFSQTFALLLAAVGLVLLIACANVANLNLARAAERRREIALRRALGASHARIVVQLVTESVAVALLGGVIGVGVAFAAVRPLAGLIPANAGVPFLDQAGLDARVLAFSLAVSALAGVVAGLLPARQAARGDLAGAFREDGRGLAPGAGWRRLRQGLVVAEVALSVVVVAAAGLLLQSYTRLHAHAPGFDAERILKLRTSLRGEGLVAPEKLRGHFDELQRRLAALPGVAAASGISFEPPIAEQAFGLARLRLPGHTGDPLLEPSAVRKVALPGYFETMGVPLLRGRTLDAADGPESRRVVVVNEAMARRYFAGVDPIGRSFSVDGPRSTPLEIVGVVGSVMTAGTQPEPHPVFYEAYAQAPIPIMSMVLRASGQPASLAPSAERVAWSLAPDVNVYAIETLDQRILEMNWRQRFGALLLATFGLLALALGAAGIYAVIAYSVVQRRGEIAVRMALGARPGGVLGMVLGDSLRLAAAGVGLGLLGAFGLGRLLEGLLYGVGARDPGTLAGVALLLLVVAVAASLAPALRAMRVDPIVALRG